MNGFTTIPPEEISGNVIEKIGREWMLLAAEKDGRVNMMTASFRRLPNPTKNSLKIYSAF